MSSNQNNTMVAVGLEVLPGLLLQTFGIGHLFKGRVGMGLGIMVSYWALQVVNAMLCTVWIGFITGPLTWLAYMIAAPTNLLEERG